MSTGSGLGHLSQFVKSFSAVNFQRYFQLGHKRQAISLRSRSHPGSGCQRGPFQGAQSLVHLHSTGYLEYLLLFSTNIR